MLYIDSYTTIPIHRENNIRTMHRYSIILTTHKVTTRKNRKK